MAGLIRSVASGAPKGCVMIFFGIGLIMALAGLSVFLYTACDR